MRLRLLSVLATITLVTACESTTDTISGVTDTGAMNNLSSGGHVTVPAPAVLSQGEFERAVSQDRIFFDFDKSVVRSDAKLVLTRWADWIKQHPQNLVTLEGHADERGTREYNLALGEKRANAVKEFLVTQGVAPDQITTLSYGKERPAVPGTNETAWAQNRRVIAIVSLESML
ncbi:18K peptidoglycan-associated outer membrane lipoprotein; Peptidoglycan-associated lipoprotein precursor; Outer membrane protein P6; OmpA/MotB precursor [invertebrate metagenome]|uniref:18K peptidoglycan-associated outer membrane lipoprotein Peptidoglycan-associated lipoprotein Outer membrane protein P6 OmpA/MotB n=1 Tax=invertebrate metagenome TaxID=1711999 RepID=A0A484HCJ8_9ZZZZ